MHDTLCNTIISLAYWKGELAWLWQILGSGTFWMASATITIAGATIWNARLFNRHNKLNIELQCSREEMDALTVLSEFYRTSNERMVAAAKALDLQEFERVRVETEQERKILDAKNKIGRATRERILRKYGLEDLIEEVGIAAGRNKNLRRYV